MKNLFRTRFKHHRVGYGQHIVQFRPWWWPFWTSASVDSRTYYDKEDAEKRVQEYEVSPPDVAGKLPFCTEPIALLIYGVVGFLTLLLVAAFSALGFVGYCVADSAWLTTQKGTGEVTHAYVASTKAQAPLIAYAPVIVVPNLHYRRYTPRHLVEIEVEGIDKTGTARVSARDFPFFHVGQKVNLQYGYGRLSGKLYIKSVETPYPTTK